MSEEIDPSEFVQRIQQLSQNRDEEDRERVRKLEEEIIQGRSERLARRAERARSLSPDKPTTPRSTTDTSRAVQEKATSTPTPTMSPPAQQNARDDTLERLTGSPAQILQADEPRKPSPNAAAMRRSGTLSWQQRPQSGSMRRPISRSTSPDKAVASPRDTPEPSSPADPSASRSEIAQSLGAKDPSWFKQTPDRGIGSAALRRSQEDSPVDVDPTAGRRQLPGMSRDSTLEPEASSPPPDSHLPSSPPREDSGRENAAGSNHLSANISVSGGDTEPNRRLRSPLPILDSQKFSLPLEPASSADGGDQAAAGRALAMSPTQGRMSPERPASPTKGMGGFVQSAMLKRSDSVNKRWSTQTPQGLTRRNSTLSNRASVALSAYGTLSKPESRPSSLSRDNSMEPSSRPGSSSSNLTITKDVIDKEPTPKHDFVKPSLPYHSRSKSVASTFSETNPAQEEMSPPSPSKRWSPTKSSWLESALKKPESPKPMLPPPQQPSWMAEINRARQQRGSVDLGKDSPILSPHADGTGSGRTSPFKDVQLKRTSLRRSESPKKDESSGFRRAESPSKDDFRGFRRPESPQKETSPSFRRPSVPKKDDIVDLGKPESPEADTPPVFRKPEQPKKEELVVEQTESSPTSKPVLSPKSTISAKDDAIHTQEPFPRKDSIDASAGAIAPSSSKPVSSSTRFSKDSPVPPLSTKAKADITPTKDFRASLRSRQGPPGSSDLSKKDSVSELANVFGRLKKTETKNYVAPDVLKDNILRGKQGLTLTGGPKPTVRRDEFKDSIVTKKAAMLAKAQEEGSAAHKRADSSSEPAPTPEAIARRRTLGSRSDSISNPAPMKEQESATPEAIARQKILRLSKSTVFEKQAQAAPTIASKELPKSNKLADRFNPGLAGILARGPPAVSNSPSSSGGTSNNLTKTGEEDKKGPAPELTHITKGRARGPKRRAPASKEVAAEPEITPQKVAPAAAVPLVKAERSLPSNVVSRTDQTPEERPVTRTLARDTFKPKPATPAKLSGEPPMIRTASSESFKAKPATSAKPSEEPPMNRSASRESFKARLATPAKLSEEPSSPRALSRESLKPKPATPSKLTEELPTTDLLARESLTPKPATPAKSPELGRRLEKSTSPELPRKPVSLELDRRVSPGPSLPPKKPIKPEVVGSPKEASPSSRLSIHKSSRPLPALPSEPEVQMEPKPALKEISPLNVAISPVENTPSPPEQRNMSVRSASALWSRQSASPPVPAKPKTPIKLPTRADEQALMENASLTRLPESADTVPTKPQAQKPKLKPVGLGLGSFGSLGGFVGASSRESSPLSAKALPPTPPSNGHRPQSLPFKPSSMPSKSDELFGDFFDELPVTSGELPANINTLDILQNPPLDLGPGGKVRTLRKQIQEITGDGKLTAVPVHEEHVLYQDSMYLCIHVFEDSKGARATEVYLWAGSGVAEATLEDVQLFGRNAAKQAQGKLIILRQGKEIPNFFEALGGIVLTRRGIRATSKEYMLCGRRHLGHITFDEVDYSLKSLCTGFTYIISTKRGKIFLWKGRGCSAEEVSGARLMGMDLTMTGELAEIEEGSEPPELFAFLPPNEAAAGSKGKLPAIPRSADYWRHKATADKYRVRLYKIEQQQESYGWGQGLQVSAFLPPLLRRPSWGMFSAAEKPTEPPQTPSTPRSPPPTTTKVIEIMPFCQSDLEPEYIYVLDTFFDIYIIVGSLSRSQSMAFSTALLFAQEYSILAVSEEDRPFMPVATVVLEGVPKDMKSVFRFWNDDLIPAAGLMNGKLGRGKSLRIVGLEKALDATRRLKNPRA